MQDGYTGRSALANPTNPANLMGMFADPMTAIYSILGSGLLSSLSTALGGESEQEKNLRSVLEEINKMMPTLGKPAYSKDELDAIAKKMGDMYRGGANVAAGGVGASLSEGLAAAGVPQGQAKGDMYMQQLAPIIAEGENKAAGAVSSMTELFAKLDSSSKDRILQALGLKATMSSALSDKNSLEKLFSSFLGGAGLGAQAYGNLAEGYKNFNWKP